MERDRKTSSADEDVPTSDKTFTDVLVEGRELSNVHQGVAHLHVIGERQAWERKEKETSRRDEREVKERKERRAVLARR